MTVDRPWRLEVFENGAWATWSNYRDEGHAISRRDKLIDQCHNARVVPSAACSVCGENHSEGSCLI